MIAYPFRLFRCCLVTDCGGALILIFGRARPRLPAKLAPCSEQGAGPPARRRRECRDADGQSDGRFHLLARVSRCRHQGLRRGRHDPQLCRPSNDLRRPLFAARGKLCTSADLRTRRSRLCAARRAGAFIAERNTAPAAGCRSTPMAAGFPTWTPGMYGMYALAGERAPDARHRRRPNSRCKISVCQGVGGRFAASGTIITSNEA